MAFEDTKRAAIAETSPAMPDAIVAPIDEISERPRKPVSEKMSVETIYDAVGKPKGLRVRPRPGWLVEYIDLKDLDHRRKCRVSIQWAPARGRPRKFEKE